MELLHARPSKGARSEGAGSPSAQLPAGTYVTDERRLFRVVRLLAAERGERPQSDEPNERRQRLLELEDCRTLEIVLCPSAALTRAGLRRVVPTFGA